MNSPLWVDPEAQCFPALDRDVNVDLAIIGAGFSGLGAAWAAAQQGATVAVLESRTIASGASGRNAGFVLAGPAMGFAASVRLIGLDQTLEIWRLTRDNHTLLSTLIADLGIECGYLRRGSMVLAASVEEWGDIQQDCLDMRDAGIDACRVEASALPRPFDRLYAGGVYLAGNGEIEPGGFLRGLAQHLSSGVQIFEASPVRSLDSGDGLTLQTPHGSVRAPRVVIATNAYTPAIFPQLPIAAVRGQVASTVALDTVTVPFPMYADRGFQYWRQTVSGRIVAGGWRNLAPDAEIGLDEGLHGDIQAAITHFLSLITPHAGIERRWAGIMGFTPDHFPLVGGAPGTPGVYLAAGYSGHGVAMAFQCGALAARAAFDSSTRIPAAFDPGRFTPEL